MAPRVKLPVIGTAIESWRLLLRLPQATLLTMALAAVWLYAVLRAATLLSHTSAPFSSGPDGHPLGMLSLAVSGGFALSGWLVLAALVMLYWARAAAGRPAVPIWSGWRSLAHAVGLSAILLAALGALWLVSFTLLGLPFGARPVMMVEATPVETFADLPAGWFLDPKLLPFLGACIVAAFTPVRLALGLAAIALGRAVDFRRTWSLGSGNGWRLLATLLLALVPVWLAGMVVDPPIVLRGDRDWIWWIRSELDWSLNGLQFALAGIVFALSYRRLGGVETDATQT